MSDANNLWTRALELLRKLRHKHKSVYERQMREHRDKQTANSSLNSCAETRRISGKTKITGITTISRLHSHPRFVKFGSGTFELYRALKFCIWQKVRSASLDWQYHENGKQNYQSQVAESWKNGLSDSVAVLGIIVPVFDQYLDYLGNDAR